MGHSGPTQIYGSTSSSMLTATSTPSSAQYKRSVDPTSEHLDRDTKRARTSDNPPSSADLHDRDLSSRDRDGGSSRHRHEDRFDTIDTQSLDQLRDRNDRSYSRTDRSRDRSHRSSRLVDDQPIASPYTTTDDPNGDGQYSSRRLHTSRRGESYYDDDRESRRSSRRSDTYYESSRDTYRRSSTRRDESYYDESYDRDYDRGRRSRGGGGGIDASMGDLGRDKGFGFSFGGSHHLGRYRSPSPPPGTIALDKRPRPPTKFDIIPPGYENISAMEAKATNNFLLPCHKAVLKLQPGNLVGPTGIPRTMGYPIAPIAPGSQSFQARTARRLYFGNLPREVSDADLISFVNQQMQSVGHDPSAMSASFGGDRSFAFVEFREASHATSMLHYDNQWQFGCSSLRIKRPRDYVPLPGEEPVFSHMSNGHIDNSSNPDKLFIGGIPRNLTEIQVRELLEAFGSVQSFNLIMDSEKGESKGYAFCEFAEGATADVAIEGLNGMEIGERKLVVQRASVGPKPANVPVLPPTDSTFGQTIEPSDGPPDGILVPTLQAANGMGAISRILVLLNLASFDEVRQPHLFEELIKDVRQECSLHGRLEDLYIPQIPEPSTATDQVQVQPILQAFATFSDEFECQNALRNICGRTYRGRTVVAAFFPESRWLANDFYGAQALGQAVPVASSTPGNNGGTSSAKLLGMEPTPDPELASVTNDVVSTGPNDHSIDPNHVIE